MLWNDDETRTVVCLDKLTEMSWHRFLVMRHENPTIACGTSQHFFIVHAGQAGSRRSPEVDGWRTPQNR